MNEPIPDTSPLRVGTSFAKFDSNFARWTRKKTLAVCRRSIMRLASFARCLAPSGRDPMHSACRANVTLFEVTESRVLV